MRRVLGNIDEVYAANCAFWNEHLLPMLEAARSTRQPLDPSSMRNAFVQVSDRWPNGHRRPIKVRPLTWCFLLLFTLAGEELV